MPKRSDKLAKLAEIEGIDLRDTEQVGSIVIDSVNPGICMNDGCEYTTQVEPDQAEGYCEECKTKTVMSLAMLMYLI